MLEAAGLALASAAGKESGAGYHILASLLTSDHPWDMLRTADLWIGLGGTL